MATMGGLSVSGPKVLVKASGSEQKARPIHFALPPRPGTFGSNRVAMIRPVRAAPDRISEKVEESIKNAQEACAGDPTSGECVAAWDEVEELSAAASHARDKLKEKESDPLENFCKDNPETIECKTHDN